MELEAKIEKVQQEMRAAGIVEDSQEWLEEMEALNEVGFGVPGQLTNDSLYDLALADEGANEARESLAILDELHGMDPLHLKNLEHLTPEERELGFAYQRIMERRKRNIAERLNFFEISRNEDLFKKAELDKLLSESLAKNKDQELPPEF